MVSEKLSDEFIYSRCPMGCLFGRGYGAQIGFLPFSAGRNQLMLEGLDECGKEQQTTNQGTLLRGPWDGGTWWPERELGMVSWFLLARGVRGGWNSRVWASGPLPSHSLSWAVWACSTWSILPWSRLGERDP